MQETTKFTPCGEKVKGFMLKELWRRIERWFDSFVWRAIMRHQWRRIGMPVEWSRDRREQQEPQVLKLPDTEAISLHAIMQAAREVGANPRHAVNDMIRWGGMPTWTQSSKLPQKKEGDRWGA